MPYGNAVKLREIEWAVTRSQRNLANN